ncbi:MarC family NAAT transporter [Pseudaeromonas sp. ZJS20]|uniref:MarC family NAAT transporter n=1 Tax=Pseudaeromonas aegiceratis TaxID=3153928 RepID=UPI00390C9D36
MTPLQLTLQLTGMTVLALLPMVNPPTTATLLLGLSKGMSREQLRRTVNQTTLYLFCTLSLTLFVGSGILEVFGISMPGLRLAGGMVIGFIGFRMLFPQPGHGVAEPEGQNIAFVPLTMPSLCGPGTMAVIISGAAQIADAPDEVPRWPLYLGVLLGFALISLISWGTLRLAGPVCRLLGQSGIDAMTRIMGFLLICMGVQFGINGVMELAQDPAFAG